MKKTSISFLGLLSLVAMFAVPFAIPSVVSAVTSAPNFTATYTSSSGCNSWPSAFQNNAMAWAETQGISSAEVGDVSTSGSLSKHLYDFFVLSPGVAGERTEYGSSANMSWEVYKSREINLCWGLVYVTVPDVNGACVAYGSSVPSEPTGTSACSQGTYVNSPADDATYWKWSCNGFGAGSDVTNCQAPKPVATYTVTFNGNGSTGGSMSPQTKTHNVNLTLTSNAFTRTGYSFTGWNTVAGGTGTPYANGATYSTNASVTLYAQWSVVSYSCTGTTPSNSNLCSNDDTGLTADTPKTVVTSCTATKCEYTCSAGYVKSGSSCVPSGGGPYTLNVTKSGTGTGTVSGTGISCGSDCSESYSSGTVVTLTASAGVGSTFASWSGACSGTVSTCAVTMDASKSANAIFNTTASSPPTIITDSATGVTSSGATLNGRGNPNGFAATGWFRYSTTNPGSCNNTFGTRAPASGSTSLGSGSSLVAFSQSITGLTSGATYYYCAIGSNTNGTAYGSISSFVATTITIPPIPTGLTATAGACGTGQINLSWNSSSGATSYSLRDSTTIIYTGSATSYSHTGLTASSSHSYSVRATNSAGSSSYSTAVNRNAPGNCPPVLTPYVVTNPAANITQTGATLSGSSNPKALSTTGWFRYATTTSPGTCNDTFGTRVPSSGTLSYGSGSSTTTVSSSSNNRFYAGNTYFYCAIAQNTHGLGYGNIEEFTTLPYTLTVTKSGTGSGTVSGIGIDCGSDCSGDYSSGTTTLITASPSPGSTFAGWSGSCSGTLSTCSVLMNANRSVTAAFNLAPLFDYNLSNTGNLNITRGTSNVSDTKVITKTLTSGTTQSVTITATGMPSGVSIGYDGNRSSNPTGTSVITFTVSPTASLGSHLITVTGQPLGKTTMFDLVISAGSGLSVTCVGTPPVALLGQNITWTAYPSGGTGTYFYSWSGTNIPTLPAPPNSNPYVRSYSTTGLKTANVLVTDNGGSTPVTCSPTAATVQINFDPSFEEF